MRSGNKWRPNRDMVILLGGALMLSFLWDSLPEGLAQGYPLRFYGNGVSDIDRVKISIDPQVSVDLGGDFTLEWWMKALPGGTPTPSPSSPDTIRVAVIGDYGWDGQPEEDIANLVKSWNPDLIITTGDNNYPDGDAFTIDTNIGQYYHEFIYPYTGSFGAGASTNRFFPSLGNHDWRSLTCTGGSCTGPYFDYFTLPGNERYYDFSYGPVHFFVLNSDTHEPDGAFSTSTQSDWLQSRLAASSAPWKIVYFHHAPFSSDAIHGSNPRMQWPYQQWGATAVLAGHAHTYERIISNGFPYFVNGLGGRSIYYFGPPITGSQVRYNDDYGAMLLDVDFDRITFQFISITGDVIDTYTIPAPTPTPTCGPAIPPVSMVLESGDYDGDGTSDIAVFRESLGLWAVRGITRNYFGITGDRPASGDYDGDGTSEIAIFRDSSGLWAILGTSRLYFGQAGDLSSPADYDGDGCADVAIFREAGGLWAIRNLSRSYFGTIGDWPLPGDYSGNGTETIAVFRPGAGLWALQGVSRIYFGAADDWPLPGDYDGDGTRGVGIFRAGPGLWALRKITRVYYGRCTDRPVPADYIGNSVDDVGIFRAGSGLWAVRGLTRVYFGTLGDIPVAR